MGMPEGEIKMIEGVVRFVAHLPNSWQALYVFPRNCVRDRLEVVEGETLKKLGVRTRA